MPFARRSIAVAAVLQTVDYITDTVANLTSQIGTTLGEGDWVIGSDTNKAYRVVGGVLKEEGPVVLDEAAAALYAPTAQQVADGQRVIQTGGANPGILWYSSSAGAGGLSPVSADDPNTWTPITATQALPDGNYRFDLSSAVVLTQTFAVGQSVRLTDISRTISATNTVSIGTGADTFIGPAGSFVGPLVLNDPGIEVELIHKTAGVYEVKQLDLTPAIHRPIVTSHYVDGTTSTAAAPNGYWLTEQADPELDGLWIFSTASNSPVQLLKTVGGLATTGSPGGLTPQPGWNLAANLMLDRVYDSDATTLQELSDVVGTMIEDLKLAGVYSV